MAAKQKAAQQKAEVLGRWEQGPGRLLLMSFDDGSLGLLISKTGGKGTFSRITPSDEDVAASITDAADDVLEQVSEYVSQRDWLTPDEAALARASEAGL